MNNSDLIALLIPSLMVTIGIAVSIVRYAHNRRIKKNSLSKCTNCGHDVIKFYYKGSIHVYCENCNLGYKPKRLFINANGNLYAEEITESETKDIILDSKYYPRYIKPTKCHVCGSKLKYNNEFIGFSKCMSCGHYYKYNTEDYYV